MQSVIGVWEILYGDSIILGGGDRRQADSKRGKEKVEKRDR